MKMLSRSLNVAITAGGSGIGRALVSAFVEEGCQVFTCDINKTLITKFKSELPNCFIQQTDVSDYSQVVEFFDGIKKEIDHLDVLINCAGISGPTANVEEINPTDWDDTIQVNLNGMFYVIREAIPFVKKSTCGSIINIASNAAFFGFPLRAPYTAAKWAVIGLTKTLAMELGADGIRVNAICPGSVSGDRIDRVIVADAKKQNKTIDEIKELYVRQVSMKTFVEASDVANLALFLSSDYGRFISGQAIGLDGHTEGLSNN